MAVKKKSVGIVPQEELSNELLSEEIVEEVVEKAPAETGIDVSSEAENAMDNLKDSDLPVASEGEYGDLRSHKGNYVAANKRAHEAIVTVCNAKTGKRITISVKQAKMLIGFSKGDWLDIRYSDSTNTVLIGKSNGAYGISPISNDKKHIIYEACTVKDFVDTLYLDYSNCASHSAYTYKIVNLEGRPFIALTHDDFA